MRSSKNRSRSKGNRGGGRPSGNIVNRVFDSSGPEGKVRGTPQQIIDKYQTLARDAQLAGDRVAVENFLQHAEHYTRMLGEAQREMEEKRQQQEREQQARQERERAEREARDARRAEEQERRAEQEPQQDAQPAPDGAGEDAPKPKRSRSRRSSQRGDDASPLAADPRDEGDEREGMDEVGGARGSEAAE